MPVYRDGTAPPMVKLDTLVATTPDALAMDIQPPPVSFDMIEDLGRICGSIKAMAELAGARADEQTLRRVARLIMVEKEMRKIVHADMLLKRGGLSEDADTTTLFPHYRTFHDYRLIVQDLHAVWDGSKWCGDGACTFNKWFHGSAPNRTQGEAEDHVQHRYFMPEVQRAMIMHTSMDDYTVGERRVSGCHYIPSTQNFSFSRLKPGDYITGEMYVEIC